MSLYRQVGPSSGFNGVGNLLYFLSPTALPISDRQQSKIKYFYHVLEGEQALSKQFMHAKLSTECQKTCHETVKLAS